MRKLDLWHLAYEFHSIVWRFMRQAVELGSGSYHSDHRHRLLSLLKSEFLRPAGSAHVKGYCRVWVWTAFFVCGHPSLLSSLRGGRSSRRSNPSLPQVRLLRAEEHCPRNDGNISIRRRSGRLTDDEPCPAVNDLTRKVGILNSRQ